MGLAADEDLNKAVQNLVDAVKPIASAGSDEDLGLQYAGDPKALEAVGERIIKAISDVAATINPPLQGLLSTATSRQFSRTALQQALTSLTEVYQVMTRTNLVSETQRAVVRETIRRIQGQIVTSNLTANPAIGAFTPVDTTAGIGRPTPALGIGMALNMPGYPGGGMGMAASSDALRRLVTLSNVAGGPGGGGGSGSAAVSPASLSFPWSPPSSPTSSRPPGPSLRPSAPGSPP